MKPTTPGKPADKTSTAQAFDDALAAEQDMTMNLSDPAEIERMQSELSEAKDRALRTQAELDNYRKRSQREMEDSLRYANMNLMRDLLPIVDNLRRAADSAEKTSDVAGLLAGVKMVAAQFEDVLARHHCKRITAHGEAFDPNFHEAIVQQPSDEYPQGTVMLEATTGFQLHDRVVRPTQVIVSSGPAQS
jgi:molecular chaperone GrpE